MTIPDPLVIATIAAIPAGLSAWAAVIAARNHVAVKKVQESLLNVSIRLDGRLDELLSVTKTQANAQGRLEERAQTAEDARVLLRNICPMGHECPLPITPQSSLPR